MLSRALQSALSPPSGRVPARECALKEIAQEQADAVLGSGVIMGKIADSRNRRYVVHFRREHIDHPTRSTELTRKDRLWMNFRDMAGTPEPLERIAWLDPVEIASRCFVMYQAQTFGDAFDFVPQTFVVTPVSHEIS